MPARVNAENFDTEVLKSDKPVLVDFYSDSCVPCKRLSPVLFQIEEEYADSLKVVKLNINFDSSVAEQYKVYAAPTVVFFKNGIEQTRLHGLVKKSELIVAIENLK